MKESKIILRANFDGYVIGERHFNVAYKTYDGIAHFLQAEIVRTRKLGRERFPDVDFSIDYIMPDLEEGEEPNVYLS